MLTRQHGAASRPRLAAACRGGRNWFQSNSIRRSCTCFESHSSHARPSGTRVNLKNPSYYELYSPRNALLGLRCAWQPPSRRTPAKAGGAARTAGSAAWRGSQRQRRPARRRLEPLRGAAGLSESDCAASVHPPTPSRRLGVDELECRGRLAGSGALVQHGCPSRCGVVWRARAARLIGCIHIRHGPAASRAGRDMAGASGLCAFAGAPEHSLCLWLSWQLCPGPSASSLLRGPSCRRHHPSPHFYGSSTGRIPPARCQFVPLEYSNVSLCNIIGCGSMSGRVAVFLYHGFFYLLAG
jgi:hypothetical protein